MRRRFAHSPSRSRCHRRHTRQAGRLRMRTTARPSKNDESLIGSRRSPTKNWRRRQAGDSVSSEHCRSEMVPGGVHEKRRRFTCHIARMAMVWKGVRCTRRRDRLQRRAAESGEISGINRGNRTGRRALLFRTRTSKQRTGLREKAASPLDGRTGRHPLQANCREEYQ